VGLSVFLGSWGGFGVWYLLLVLGQALRFSHRGRGTLLQQPKRVPRKGRHVGYAPVEDTGVPIESVLLACCARTRVRLKARALRQLAQKAHANSTLSLACQGGGKVKN